VKTVMTAGAQAVGLATEQPAAPTVSRQVEEDQPEEAFEARILRLDGAMAEQLFRLLEE
jgi:hypothetical protein